jgi:hypothetical protein
MKLTEWYPGNVKPVRVGVYERQYGLSRPTYCWWNGLEFCSGHMKKSGARKLKDSISPYQDDPWRGIAGKPQ